MVALHTSTEARPWRQLIKCECSTAVCWQTSNALTLQ